MWSKRRKTCSAKPRSFAKLRSKIFEDFWLRTLETPRQLVGAFSFESIICCARKNAKFKVFAPPQIKSCKFSNLFPHDLPHDPPHRFRFPLRPGSASLAFTFIPDPDMITRLSDTHRGAAFMVFAMGAFALEDMALKAAARDIPIGQAVAMFGLAGTAIFAFMARAQGQRILHPDLLSPVLIWRSLFEISGRLFYALAIALTPLSSASAILQATPLVVALGAVIVFGERVGLRRWLAIGIGFIGVLMILRPGLEAFDPLSVFAVLGTLGFAGRDLATRASPPSLSVAQLGVAGFVVLTLAGLVLIGFGGVSAPTPASLGFVALATGIGVLAYGALTRAMRLGEVSVVAPFRYSRLLFALVLGVTVFGERPDLMTLLGSAVIVASGVILLQRSARR